MPCISAKGSFILAFLVIAFLGCGNPPQRALDLETRYKVPKGLTRIGDVEIQIKITADGTVFAVPKDATLATLKFEEACELRTSKDGTLLATKEGVTAKDSDGSLWESRKVTLDDKAVYAFFKK